MPEPSALSIGFALAATIARDPGAKLAHIGIAPDVRDAWCGLARDLERCGKAERRERIRKLTAGLRRRTTNIPAGRAKLAGVPDPRGVASRRSIRPGFAPEPQLVALLRRIAARNAVP